MCIWVPPPEPNYAPELQLIKSECVCVYLGAPPPEPNYAPELQLTESECVCGYLGARYSFLSFTYSRPRQLFVGL